MKVKKFVFVLFAALFPIIASAEYLVEKINYFDVEIDGVFYKLNSTANEATVVMGCTERANFEILKVASYKDDVVIPESFVFNGIKYTVTAIGGRHFPYEDASYADSYGAFEGCSELTSITLPASINKIGSCAFYGCTSLKAVYISDLSTWCSIDFEEENSRLNSIDTSNPLCLAHDLYLNGEIITDLIIPENILSVKAYSFYGCSISSVTFHENTSSIGDYAFQKCNNLTDVFCFFPFFRTYEGVFDDYSKKTLHIREIYYNDFKYQEDNLWRSFGNIEFIHGIDFFNLTYFVDGKEYKSFVLEVGEVITPLEEPLKMKGYTFSGWNNIPATMPGKDVEVRGSFSYSKKDIDGVTYQVIDADNETAEAIGSDNASGEVKIADEVEFDDGTYKVTKIADNAFNGQNSITAFEIGKNVTTIGERAFANNNKLNDVFCYAEEVPETDRTAFENSYIDYVMLHVPAGSVDKYKAVGPWKDFKDVVAIAATGDERCATPTIKFDNGKVSFACETEGVKFRYQITNADVKSSDGAEVELGGVYNVRVYALKEGLRDSEAATMEIKLPTVKGDLNDDRMVDVKDHVVLSNIIMNIQEVEAEVEQEETE